MMNHYIVKDIDFKLLYVNIRVNEVIINQIEQKVLSNVMMMFMKESDLQIKHMVKKFISYAKYVE